MSNSISGTTSRSAHAIVDALLAGLPIPPPLKATKQSAGVASALVQQTPSKSITSTTVLPEPTVPTATPARQKTTVRPSLASLPSIQFGGTTATATRQVEAQTASTPPPTGNPAAFISEMQRNQQAGEQAAKRTAEQPQAIEAGVKPGTVDPESRVLLEQISEDFIMLTGKESYAYHIESGDLMGKESLIHYCEEQYGTVLVANSKGEWERKSSGELWWGWRDHSRRRRRRVVLVPTLKAEDEGNRQVFNLWYQRKRTMCPPAMNANHSDILPLVNHLMYISDNDQVVVSYFMNWLAQLYQFPDSKIPSAILFYSRKTGVGKSLLHKLLAAVFGPSMVGNCSGKALTKSFDDVTEHKRLLFVNEVAGSERVDWYENFKNLVSEEETSFEGKGRAARDIVNITHYIITTNHKDALPLAQGDRRIAVFKCEAEPKHPDYYVELRAWMEGPGPALLAGVLAQWKFTEGWNPYAPVPQTAAAKALQNVSQGALFLNLTEMLEARLPPFHRKAFTTNGVSQYLRVGEDKAALWGCKTSSDAVGKALGKMGLEPWVGKVEFTASKKGGARAAVYLLDECDEWWQNLSPRDRGIYLEGNGTVTLVQSHPSGVDHE